MEPTPEQTAIFATYVNPVRVLFSQANNVWGTAYVTAGGQKNDEVAVTAGDAALVAFIRESPRWPDVKEAMLKLVELDNKLSL